MNIIYGGSYKNNIGGRIEGSWSSDNLINFYKNNKYTSQANYTTISQLRIWTLLVNKNSIIRLS